MRPTVRAAAAVLLAEFPQGVDAIKAAEQYNCDVRRAKLELASGAYVDKARARAQVQAPANALEALSTALYPYRGIDAALGVAEDPMVPIAVAENYYKEKGASLERLARAADDISAGDAYKAPDVFAVASAPYGSAALSSRPTFPVADAANRHKGVDFRVANAMERRIVVTLAHGAPPAAVAKEMHSMGLTRIDQWEAVRALAPLGREPTKISADKKEALSQCLCKKI